MASIKRHPKSPFWMACFTLPDGRRTTRSTGTSEKKDAQRIANHYEDVANEGKAKTLTESRARKTIADFFALSNRDKLASSSITLLHSFPLYQQKVWKLMDRGYSQKEAEKMCRPDPIDYEKFETEIMKEQEKELKRLARLSGIKNVAPRSKRL